MRVITIGRSPKCDVVILDAKNSRIHLQILINDDGDYYAVDMNSISQNSSLEGSVFLWSCL